ncbi:hypothetical protein E4U11_000511 [Claviceps purpurea]|nr:hypothetical protein E4U11_000511 [Claviceps purpurea]
MPLRKNDYPESVWPGFCHADVDSRQCRCGRLAQLPGSCCGDNNRGCRGSGDGDDDRGSPGSDRGGDNRGVRSNGITIWAGTIMILIPYPQRTPGPLNETVAYDYTSQLSRLGKHSVAISVIQTHRTIQIANISHLVPVVISPPPRMRQLMQENLSKDLVIASISRRMESNMTQRDLVGSVLRTKFQDGIPSPDYLFTIQV